MDVVTLAICNKKIAGVLAGIDRIEVDDPNKRLTFYFPNGTSASMNFPIPRDGASITDIKVNEEGYLVCRMSDGTTVVSDDPIQTASASTVSYKDNKTVEDVLDELLESGGGTGGSVDGITVPTKTSDLTNDSGFITSDDLPTVPTKVSDLANDKNYISSIPSEYVTETELTAKKYLTSVPSTYALKTDIPTVPTKTSDLTNDSNFITSIPEEYITETELNAKGYLTSHQDISGLQPKTDDSLTTTDKTVIGAINELKSGLDDKVNKTDITTTINSTSTDTQIPTAKSVNVAIKGKLITQEDIDTYGKEIIKFPVGKWVIGSVAISNLTDLPNSYVRYIEIIGISEVTNPWTNNNTLRSYKATSYKGDTFLRSLNSGSEAGVIASDTGWQRVLLNGDIIDNLTSTDTNKLLSANQGKILNDTKLNKTDANKLNCVTIDNVSLKEYILTNFTETGKTYYLVAKTTCTDLPKASNFYITVETPGMYTYKVTAKELNDSNGIYVCTYRTISSSWTKWEKVCTTTVADVSKTNIAFMDTTNFSTIPTVPLSYVVKNGLCTISGGVTCNTSASTAVTISESMPVPSAISYGIGINTDNPSDQILVILTENIDGQSQNISALKLKFGTAGSNYRVTFTYPVAE